MLKLCRYDEVYDRLKLELVVACNTIEIENDVGFTCVCSYSFNFCYQI